MEKLAVAILAWFAAQDASWIECGHRYTEQEARGRAEWYAGQVSQGGTRWPAPESGWWMVAVMANESGFDGCALGPRVRERQDLPWKLTRAGALRALGRLRKPACVGVAQWAWPVNGIGKEEALDAAQGVSRLARAMPGYLADCRRRFPRGVKLAGRRRPCEEVYWVFHNVSWVNVRFYRGVKLQERRMNHGKDEQT